DWGPREPVIVVQSRDQKTVRILAVDPRTGMTRGLREDTNPYWVTSVPGVPAFTGSGALAWAADSAQTRRLLVDGDAVTPPGLQVREVISVDGDTVLFAASTEPADIGLWTFSVTGGLRQAAEGPGVHQGHRAGGTTVIASESLDHDGVRVNVQRDGMPEMEITSSAEPPVLTPRVELS